MERITLAGKEYKFPEIDFQVMYDLSNLGFDIMNIEKLKEKSTGFIAAVIGYITDKSEVDAVKLINNSIQKGENTFGDIYAKCISWLLKSDFFKSQVGGAKK